MSPMEWDLPVVEADPGDLDHEHDENDVAEEEDDEVLPFAGLDYMDEEDNNGVLTLSPQRNAIGNVSKTIAIHEPNILRNILVDHFSVCFKLGRIQWPKNMRRVHRHAFHRPNPIVEPAAVMRALCIVRETLIVKKSNLLLIQGVGSSTNMLDVIGKGLFSSILIQKGDVIVDFIGEFITATVAKRRDEEGFGGYMIAYTNDIVLDSYNYLNVCKASMANCPRNCWDSVRRCLADTNAKLTIDRRRRKMSLRAIVDIGPMTEILWNYGNSYRYPTFK